MVNGILLRLGTAIALAVSVSTLVHPVQAETYEVSVTRKGANIYHIDGKNIIIRTAYCYEYVYEQDSILKTIGYGGEIIFMNDGNKCDIKALFVPANVAAGNYDVIVSRDDDDLYEIFGKSIYINTSMCLSLALGSEAILKVGPGGVGRIKFVNDGNDCMVEALYTKAKF